MRRIVHILGLLCCLLLTGSIDSYAQQNRARLPRAKADSTQAKSKSTPNKKSSDAIDATISYSAQDSIVMLSDGTAQLFGQGDIKYKEMSITADYVRVVMDSNTVYACGVPDSDGVLQGVPKFSDGKDTYDANEIAYNMETKKGYIRHVLTQQGEAWVMSDIVKKGEGDEMFLAKGKYTTCDDHENPHFYLALTKAKIKPGSYIATGPAYMVLADVPLPLALPFGYFPFTKSYSSGLIVPSFDDNSVRGLGLKEGGYYWAINDYADLQITGDYYTSNTWAVNVKSSYIKRYKFGGNISFNYRQDRKLDDDENPAATNLQFTWNHHQDAKANPYASFSANVNYTTSGYNRSNIDYYNDPNLTSQNTKQSTINYTQRFPNSSWSISMTASITQRSSDSTLCITLPSMNINLGRIYPFKRKEAVGKPKWYEKISMSYSGQLSNSVTAKEKEILKANFLRDYKNGMKHTIPIQADFTLFKYINISPSFTMTDRMYFTRTNYSVQDSALVGTLQTGFYNVFDFSLGVTASTKLYGFWIPARKIFGTKIDRIRHVMTPSIGFSWAPDFGKSKWGYYQDFEYINKSGNIIQETKSRYANNLYGNASRGHQGNLTFSLSNNVEMKIRNDKDTTGTQPFKIISLIDNFTISGSYNFMADSLKLSALSVSLRLKLWKNYSLTLNTMLDPYEYGLNSNGQPVHINKYRIGHGKFFRWNGTSISIPTLTLNNETFRKWFHKSAKDSTAANNNEVDADGYKRAEIPWSISINYSLAYRQTNEFDYEKMVYKMKLTNNLSFSGNIGFGKGWKLSTSASYDFEAKKLSSMTFNVSRDLHCWSMSGYFVPFGYYKSYSFKIAVKASALQDLKYDKRNDNSRSGVWW